MAFYSQEHPLAQQLIQQAQSPKLEPAELRIDYRAHGVPIRALEPFLDRSGWLELSKLTIHSVDDYECIILTGSVSDGRQLDEDQCRKLLSIPAVVVAPQCETSGPAWDALPRIRQAIVHDLRQQLSERNARYLDEETEKLERWADDRKQTLEQELRELDRKIREARKAAKVAVTLDAKLEAQKEQRSLDVVRSRKRRELFEAQDTVDQRRDELIQDLEKQLSQRTTLEPVFTFRWTLK